MIKKQFVKSRNVTKVTFEVDFADNAQNVEVLGDFNNWQPQPLGRQKSGAYRLAVELEPGKSYEYRYRIDGRWEDDRAADRYAPNRFGTRNSVVVC